MVKDISGDGDELLKFLAPTLNAQTRAFVVHGEADQAEGSLRVLQRHR